MDSSCDIAILQPSENNKVLPEEETGVLEQPGSRKKPGDEQGGEVAETPLVPVSGESMLERAALIIESAQPTGAGLHGHEPGTVIGSTNTQDDPGKTGCCVGRLTGVCNDGPNFILATCCCDEQAFITDEGRQA